MPPRSCPFVFEVGAVLVGVVAITEGDVPVEVPTLTVQFEEGDLVPENDNKTLNFYQLLGRILVFMSYTKHHN